MTSSVRTAKGTSLYQEIFSHPYHSATHASYRLLPGMDGPSQQIRFNFDETEARERVPLLTPGVWASESYLRDFFRSESVSTTIPVYRVKLPNTAVVWSTSLNNVGAVRPTFMHADGYTAIGYMVYLTWRQFLRVQAEEKLYSSTPFAQTVVLRRTIEFDVQQAPNIYAAITHLYRPLYVKHGDATRPAQVQTFPNGAGVNSAAWNGPRLTHYQALSAIHQSEGAALQDLAVEAAISFAYRMALMSRLTAGPMHFLTSEVIAAKDTVELFDLVQRLSPNIADTLSGEVTQP